MFQENLRGACYKFLADCYYLPDAGLIDAITNGDGACDLRAEMAGAVGAGDIEAMRVDFSRLFVGPYGLLAPPYGSRYLESRKSLIGDSTLDAQRRYAEEGLNVDIKEVPDHIAIELEFMYFLIFKEAAATSNSDSESAAGYREKQKAFLETHLGRWATDFTDKVEANAQTEFYKNLARLTKSFVKKDLESLSENLSTVLS